MRANRAAFERWAIVPRMLRDVGSRDLTVELFGRRSRRRCCSRRSGCPSGPPARPTWRSPARPPPRAARTCSPTRRGARWRMRGGRWGTRRAGSSCTGRPTRSSSTASRARRGVRCEAIVVTLDTTMLGWRPRDLDLGSLPFARGEGIAQYTSDPRFRRLVGERVAAGADAAEARSHARPRCGRCSTSAGHYPGTVLRQPALPEPRAAVETSSTPTRGRRWPGPTSPRCARGPAADPAQGHPASRRRPPGRRRRGRRRSS